MASSRDQRKRDEVKRLARRELLRPVRFEGYNGSYAAAIKKEIAIAEATMPSLTKVVRLTGARFPDDFGPTYRFHGLSQSRMLTFGIDDGGHRIEPNHAGNGGGVTSFFIDADGRKRTLVTYCAPGNFSEQQNGAVLMGILFHEFGHVYDFEHGINIVDGQPLDVVASECYAHRYALRVMVERNYQFALVGWIVALRDMFAVSEVPNIAAAAQDAMASEEHAAAVRLVKHLM